MKISKFLILTVLFLTVKTQAQEAATKITSFKFEELYGGLILIQAQVGKAPDTLNFIFDTGSGGISIDSNAAVKCGLEIHLTNDSVGGIGGVRRVSRIYNTSLHFPGLTVEGLDFNVNNYEGLSNSFGVKIDGVVGYAFINRYILDVNFDSGRIAVYTRGEINYPRKSYTWGFRLAYLASSSLEVRDHKKVTSVYYIDTGGGLSMLFTEDFVKDSGLIHPRKRTVYTQVDGMAGKTDVRLTTVREVKLGPYKFRNVPAYVYTDKANTLSYPSATGLIGNDILRRFNWILNYSKKEMNLVPNRYFRDEFDYGYNGLGIYQLDSVVMITDVVKNSPGEKAGFQPGDVILAVENLLSTGYNVAQIKAALQNTRKQLQVIVIRKGEVTDLLLKVESIL
jgi:predicted aspartyl protease